MEATLLEVLDFQTGHKRMLFNLNETGKQKRKVLFQAVPCSCICAMLFFLSVVGHFWKIIWALLQIKCFK